MTELSRHAPPTLPRNPAAAMGEPTMLTLKTPRHGGARALGAAELALGWGVLIGPMWFFDGDVYAFVAPDEAKPSEVALGIASVITASVLTFAAGVGSAVSARRRMPAS